MTLEVAGIALKVDSTDAVSAQANLDKMAQAGDGAAAAFGRVESTAKTAGSALAGTAAGAAAGARGTVASATAAKSATDALKSTAEASKLTGNQTAQLSAQLQDLFVQIQAGGSPLTALLQQGSQLSAVFGGAVPALRAVGAVLFSTATAYAAVAAAGVALSAAFLVGREQSAELARALILSGNAAGLTEGRFNALAESIAESTRSTIGSTRETLQTLAGSGRITSDTLVEAATAAQLLGKVTGQASADIAKDFARAADAPARFALETNRAFNFLTASQLEYIKTLDEQGRGQEALATTFRLLIPRLEEAAGKTTGLASAFSAAKREVSAFIDSLESLGRSDTAEEGLKRIRAQIEELRKAGQAGYVFGPSMADLQAQEIALDRIVGGQREVAAARSKEKQFQDAKTAWNRLEEQSLSRQEQLAKALRDANALADQAGLSAAQRAKVLADIRLKFDGGESKARMAADIAALQAFEDQRISVYRQSEGIIDALRQSGTVQDREFYAAKRALADLEASAQERALQGEIARLQQFRGSATEQLEVRRQITQAEAKLAEVRAGSAAKAVVLNIQEKSSVDSLKRAFSELEFSAVAAFQATQRAVSRDVDAVGQSDKERQRTGELFSIRERYTQQIEQLESSFRNGSLRGQEDEFRRRRQLILDSLEFEINARVEGYRRLDVEQAKWENGASKALQNYSDQAADRSTQVQQALTDAFKGAEDALVNFATTGKLSFSQFAQSVIADLTRIFVRSQITAPLAQVLFGSGGAGLGLLAGIFGGGRASGGSVAAGTMYEVAEGGRPELLRVGSRTMLMMGSESGYVTPAASGAGAAGASPIVQHITIQSGVNANEVMAAMQRVKNETVAAVLDAQRRRYGGAPA